MNFYNAYIWRARRDSTLLCNPAFRAAGLRAADRHWRSRSHPSLRPRKTPHLKTGHFSWGAIVDAIRTKLLANPPANIAAMTAGGVASA